MFVVIVGNDETAGIVAVVDTDAVEVVVAADAAVDACALLKIGLLSVDVNGISAVAVEAVLVVDETLAAVEADGCSVEISFSLSAGKLGGSMA